MQHYLLPARFLTLSLVFSLALCGVASGQGTSANTSAASLPTATTAMPAQAPTEQRVERIHLEDGGSIIDELRIGGETKSINVQPKGGMPAYQVGPVSGERSWKVLGF